MTGTISLSRLALGSAACAVGIYGAMVYRRLSQTQGIRMIKMDYDSPTSFRSSPTMLSIVNPRHYSESVMDSRYAKLKIPSQYSDEEVIAQFVRGFFGSVVFAPEKFLANNILPKVTKFAALKDATVPTMASKKDHLPSGKLLPLYSRVVDLFQVTDSHIVDHATDSSDERESFVDFAFGCDDSTFAGAHRFSVSRSPEDPEAVTIGFSCIVVNPGTGKNMVPPATAIFHRVYAMLLFRDALAEIQDVLQAQKC